MKTKKDTFTENTGYGAAEDQTFVPTIGYRNTSSQFAQWSSLHNGPPNDE